MKPLKVTKSDTGKWCWECWRCQAGELTPTWHQAIAQAGQHRNRHEQFGFRQSTVTPGGLSGPGEGG